MNAKHKLHQAHLREWASRFADQKAQGLSNKQWCEINCISIHSYNYWKRLLKEELVDQVLPDIVPVQLPLPSPNSSPILHTQTLQNNSNSCAIRTNCTTYTLRVNGFDFEVDANASPEFLCTLLKAVRYA